MICRLAAFLIVIVWLPPLTVVAEGLPVEATEDRSPEQVRAALIALRDAHGDVVRGTVDHGLRALDAANTRRAAGDERGALRAEQIADAALDVAEKKVAVRAARARLRVLRARIANLRVRAGS